MTQWFIATDLLFQVGLRNKPNYNPTQYSIDWTNVVTSYLKKQLAKITLPSAPRLGLNIKQSFKGVLSDPDSRDGWVSRFTYWWGFKHNAVYVLIQAQQPPTTSAILRRRSCRQTHLSLMVSPANGDMQSRASRLHGPSCGRVLRWHARQPSTYQAVRRRVRCQTFRGQLFDCCFLRASSHSFRKIRSSALGQLVKLDGLLETLLQVSVTSFSLVARSSVQRICLTLPDVFVSPNTWATHSSLLVSVLSNVVRDHSLPGDQRQREVQRLLLENVSDIRRRNDAMLFRNLPPRALERLGSMVVDIQVSLLYWRLAYLAALSITETQFDILYH